MKSSSYLYHFNFDIVIHTYICFAKYSRKSLETLTKTSRAPTGFIGTRSTGRSIGARHS